MANGISILLPLQNSSSERGKVIVIGGLSTNTAPATNSVEIHDFNQGTSANPNIRMVASTQNNNNPVYVSEMFDYENKSQGWVNLPAATVYRGYRVQK